MITVLTACFLVGITWTITVWSGYKRGQSEYEALTREYTSVIVPEETTLSDSGSMPAKKEATHKNAFQMEPQLPEDAPERLSIKWDKLKEKNDDLVGWIYIPAVSISYPIVQAMDNEYYLHRGFDGEYLYSGCIFMDFYNDPTFENYNTILYGHNMRDGSMFAKLKDFQREETLQKCHYFWIFTPDGDFLYQIISVHTAPAGSEAFTLRFKDHESHAEWVKKMQDISDPKINSDITIIDRIITLSSCTESSSVRIVVQGNKMWHG